MRQLLFKALIGALITAALLAFLFRYVKWEQVSELSKNANWWLLAFALLPVYQLLYFFRAKRFLLLAPKTSLSVMLCITAIHNFMLRILPMRSGELSYAFLVKRAGTSGLGEGILDIFLLRILDATAVVIIFSFTLAFNQATYHGDATIGFIVSGLIAFFGILITIYFNELLLFGFRIFDFFFNLIRLNRVTKLASLRNKLQNVLQSYSKLNQKQIFALSGLTMILWIINFIMVYLILISFNLPISFTQAVLGGTAATVAAFLPLGGIGTFGLLEAGLTLGFMLAGIDRSLAVASSIAFSIATFAGAGFLALVSWLIFVRLIPRVKR